MIRHCHRHVCVCRDRLMHLYARIPLNETEANELATTIETKRKEHKSCLGSYKVMVRNLEKVSKNQRYKYPQSF